MSEIAERLRKPAPKLGFEEWDPTFDLRHEAATEIERLEAERTELVKALEFYADKSNWSTMSDPGDPEAEYDAAIPVTKEDGVTMCDCGDIARAALVKASAVQP